MGTENGSIVARYGEHPKSEMFYTLVVGLVT